MLARLSDGTRVVIRAIQPGDKAMLARGLELLSEETRRRRFLGAKPRLTAGELRYLTEVDGEAHFALVAVLADRLDHVVAVARYVRLPGDRATADAAIVVGDPWQRRGLGRRMAVMLADAARLRGIERFSATMLSDNPAALALMRTLARRLESGGHERGVREVVGRAGRLSARADLAQTSPHPPVGGQRRGRQDAGYELTPISGRHLG